MGISRSEATASLNEHLTGVVLSISPSQFELKNDVFAPPMEKIGITTGQIEFNTRTYLQQNPTGWTNGKPANHVDVDKPTRVEFATEPHAEMICITDRTLKERQQAGVSADDYRQARVSELAFNLLLQKELTLMTKILTAANYDAGHSVTLTNNWASDSGDPTGDIETGLVALNDAAYPGTHLFGDINVRVRLERHAALVLFGSPTMRHKVGDDEFQSIYGLKPVWTNVRYDSDGTLTAAFQDAVVLAHMPATSPSNEGPPCLVRTIYSQHLQVEEWWDDAVKGTWYRVAEEYVHQFMALDDTSDKDAVAGYLIDNAI